MIDFNRYEIAKASVAKLSLDDLFAIITSSINLNEKTTIAYQNFHGIYLLNKNKRFSEFFKDAITIIDGMPLIWMGKWLNYNLNKQNRLAWIDFMHPLMQLSAQNNWKIFYLGTSDHTARVASEKLKDAYGLEINYHHGFFDSASEENDRIIEQINNTQSDILIVGMGMPRQEFWIMDNKSKINAKLFMTCGAAFEFMAGTSKIPPRWLSDIGLEWLYRFALDPKKLWFRYLIEPWYVLYAFASQKKDNKK